MQNVIQKPHRILGDVTVTQDKSLEKFTDSNHTEPALQTISIEVSPLIVEVLHGEVANLNRLLSGLHVSVNVDKDQAAIKIVPSKHTPAGWMKCETDVKVYIENNFATMDLPVSKDAILDIVKALQQRKRELQYNFSDDITQLQLVGHPNLLIQIQNQVSEIVASVTIIDKEITLNPEDYEFLLQTKQRDITLTFPYVKMTFIPPMNIKVNGAAKDVKKFDESVLRLSAHASVTMVLDPLLTDFVSTKDGREQTKNYISTLHGIPVAMCIKASGDNCTVIVLCDPQITEKVTKAVSAVQKELYIVKLNISSKCQANLSELNTGKEYNELCEQLQKKHGVIVKISKDSISVAGFKDKVSQTISGFKEFLDAVCSVSSSPLLVTAGNIKSTSMTISWQPPHDPNGIISGYQISYTPQGETECLHDIVGDITNTELTCLKPFTVYTICVRARTVTFGVYSTPITISTLEDGECTLHIIVSILMFNLQGKILILGCHYP